MKCIGFTCCCLLLLLTGFGASAKPEAKLLNEVSVLNTRALQHNIRQKLLDGKKRHRDHNRPPQEDENLQPTSPSRHCSSGVHVPAMDRTQQNTLKQTLGDIIRASSINGSLTEDTVHEIIEVVFLRLGVKQRLRHSCPRADSVPRLIKTIMAYFSNVSNRQDLYWEKSLSKIALLAIGCGLYVDDCVCGINDDLYESMLCRLLYVHNEHHASLNMSSAIARMVSRTLSGITRHYTGNTVPHQRTWQMMKLEIATHANRLKCTTEQSILSLVMPHGSRGSAETGGTLQSHVTPVAELMSTILLRDILLGYHFPTVKEPCPSAFLNDIFNKYGRRSRISVKGVQDIMNALTRSLSTRMNTTSEETCPPLNARQHRLVLAVPHHFNNKSGDHHRAQEKHIVFLNENHESSHNHGFKLDVTCLNASKIVDIFFGKKLAHGHAISMQQFEDLCPAILQQVLSRSFGLSAAPSGATPTITTTEPTSRNRSAIVEELEPLSNLEKYGYGTLSVFIISLCSLFGVVLVKAKNSKVKSYIMAAMFALAVGCLVGDAGLHLIPESIIPEADSDDHEEIFVSPEMQKMCGLLASIYVFFLLELALSRYHHHGYEHTNEQSAAVTNHKQDDSQDTGRLVGSQNNGINLLRISTVSHNINPNEASSVEAIGSDVCQVDNLETLNKKNSVANSVLSKTSRHKSSKNLVWMITLGDGIHNFADGLALGAAFSLSFPEGISTAITVFCHELPHELGDFAVLISTGISVKRALLLNFLSSLTAFAGLYVGLAAGAQDAASQWIFTVGAGMFLYVALTNLIPECISYFKRTPSWKMFLAVNSGLLLGYVSMFLLAVFEHKLAI